MDAALGIFDDTASASDLRRRGLKQVQRWVIDLNAPGMRSEIRASLDRINASEEEANILAEVEANAADMWRLLPE